MQREKEIVEKAFLTCSWGNRGESLAEWERIIESGTQDERQRLFGIIFREDPSDDNIHRLFDTAVIKAFTAGLTRPFSRPDLERKRRIWRWVYCGERSRVPGFDWLRK
jgi:hypothetical protein